MSESVIPKCIKQLFGSNAKTLCRFTFVEDDEYSASDYLEMAIKLKDIGVKLDTKKLKEMTKLQFIADEAEEWVPSMKETE